MSHRKKKEHVREMKRQTFWKTLAGLDGEARLLDLKVDPSMAEEREEEYSFLSAIRFLCSLLSSH
jgi:hypothetical protein